MFKLSATLICAGADVNIKINETQETPLHLAIIKKNIDLVKLLISANADINVLDSNGDTPVFLADINNHAEIVNLLLLSKTSSTYTNTACTGELIEF